jgi:hypothetical protein
MSLQTILIPRTFPIDQAVEWVTKSGNVVKKIDMTPHYYRFRQRAPKRYKSFKSKKFDNGVIMVFQI